jgi:hypothetical protein
MEISKLARRDDGTIHKFFVSFVLFVVNFPFPLCQKNPTAKLPKTARK